MISNELQYQIHQGDPEAFKTLFAMRGKDVYLLALDALGNVADARSAAKQVFLKLEHELTEAPGPINVDARITALTREELMRCASEQPAADSITWEEWQSSATMTRTKPCPPAPAAVATAPHAEHFPQGAPPPIRDEAAATEHAPRLPDAPPMHDDNALPVHDVDALPARDEAPQPHTISDLPPMPDRIAAPSPRPRPVALLLWIGVGLLAVLLLWLLLNILMGLQLIPRIDLGYSWFNAQVFPLFTLQ